MSFPAGFAKMNPKRFFTYSIAGTFIWDAGELKDVVIKIAVEGTELAL